MYMHSIPWCGVHCVHLQNVHVHYKHVHSMCIWEHTCTFVHRTCAMHVPVRACVAPLTQGKMHSTDTCKHTMVMIHINCTCTNACVLYMYMYMYNPMQLSLINRYTYLQIWWWVDYLGPQWRDCGPQTECRPYWDQTPADECHSMQLAHPLVALREQDYCDYWQLR